MTDRLELADRLWMRSQRIDGLDKALMREGATVLREGEAGGVSGRLVLEFLAGHDIKLLPWQRKALEAL